jgi:hypothetical protein
MIQPQKTELAIVSGLSTTFNRLKAEAYLICLQDPLLDNLANPAQINISPAPVHSSPD